MSDGRGSHFEGAVPEGAAQTQNGSQEKRVALVIGNGAYLHTSPLPNPINDARAMTQKLQDVGFDVADGTDLTYGQMAELVRDFGRRARDAATTLLFYAGHGIQVQGRNFLVPIDAALEHESDVSLELVELQVLLNQMAAPDRTSLVFLDACRNNPLVKNLSRAMGMRSVDVGAGLAAPSRTVGTFIAYATEPDHIAYDGDGSHGYFTEELLSRMATPGLEVTGLMRQVRVAVEGRTLNKNRGAQIPWHQEALRGDFYFVPLAPGQASHQQAGPNPAPAQDYSFWKCEWEAYSNSMDMLALQSFVNHAPAYFADQARRRIEQIEADQDAQRRQAEEQARRENEMLNTPSRPLTTEENIALFDEMFGEHFGTYESLRKKQYEAQGAGTRATAARDYQVVVGDGNDDRTVTLEVGQSIQDADYAPELVLIPPGKFMMGSPASEERWEDYDGSEDPQHEVAIDYPLFVGKYAVTVAEFSSFVDATGYTLPNEIWSLEDDGLRLRKGRSFRNPGFDQSWNHPVVGVNWDDAQNYIEWLNSKTGKTYRLLSEAEWEYACRAGTTTPFSCGETISSDQANYYGINTYGIGAKGAYRAKTVPVDSFAPNAFGLHQMHGNVGEWCADPWHKDYDGAPTNGSVWSAGGDERLRVLRGACWSADPQFLRSAQRGHTYQDDRNDRDGFRLCREL